MALAVMGPRWTSGRRRPRGREEGTRRRGEVAGERGAMAGRVWEGGEGGRGLCSGEKGEEGGDGRPDMGGGRRRQVALLREEGAASREALRGRVLVAGRRAGRGARASGQDEDDGRSLGQGPCKRRRGRSKGPRAEVVVS